MVLLYTYMDKEFVNIIINLINLNNKKIKEYIYAYIHDTLGYRFKLLNIQDNYLDNNIHNNLQDIIDSPYNFKIMDKFVNLYNMIDMNNLHMDDYNKLDTIDKNIYNIKIIQYFMKKIEENKSTDYSIDNVYLLLNNDISKLFEIIENNNENNKVNNGKSSYCVIL